MINFLFALNSILWNYFFYEVKGMKHDVVDSYTFIKIIRQNKFNKKYFIE